MNSYAYKRLPKHIGIIPDGNRRWAEQNNKPKHEGYQFGIDPGFSLYEQCLQLGVKELTFYGFTQDNTKRPKVQTESFRQACIDAVMRLANLDANLLVIGNTESPLFPNELLDFTGHRVCFGKGLININFLVNYSWQWDLQNFAINSAISSGHLIHNVLGSSGIPRIDLVIRWGGRRRLSGFLPVQTVYSDFYIIDEYWPDYSPEHLHNALNWYQSQDVTLGG